MSDMKIEGPRGPYGVSGPKRTAAPAATGFAAPAAASGKMSAAAPLAAPPAIDAVLALQADGPQSRRARQTRRGERTLDALDKLKIGLLQGRAPASLKAELEALQADRGDSGDVGLDAVMLEIDTRAAVELAKLEAAKAPGR